MVRINRVYTKTGDDGTTALVGGARVGKDSARIEAYGTVDELNATIGVVRVELEGSRARDRLDPILRRVQNELFNMGSELATPDAERRKRQPSLAPRHVEALEHEIDALNDSLPELRSFILPGGTPAAAHLHLARTVCRRAERLIIELAERPDAGVSAALRQYVNRLSDFLFVASRYLNDKGAGDVLWVPGQNR